MDDMDTEYRHSGFCGMDVMELHKNWQLLDDCCDLINSEWPRSKVARYRSLQVSCENFPVNLVLVKETKVIGHSKITRIPSLPLSCFVESVVIHPSLRGKGFGKLLMLKSEDYVRQHGFHYVYLSTKDKIEFYRKLGYIDCDPVGIYGCGFTLDINQPNVELDITPIINVSPSIDNGLHEPKHLKHQDSEPAMSLPPPPPPFPSSLDTKTNFQVPCSKQFGTTKVFMKKIL